MFSSTWSPANWQCSANALYKANLPRVRVAGNGCCPTATYKLNFEPTRYGMMVLCWSTHIANATHENSAHPEVAFDSPEAEQIFTDSAKPRLQNRKKKKKNKPHTHTRAQQQTSNSNTRTRTLTVKTCILDIYEPTTIIARVSYP